MHPEVIGVHFLSMYIMKVGTKLWLAQNQNKIFGGIGILLIVVAVAWYAQPSRDGSIDGGKGMVISNGRLEAEEDSWNFGTISMAAGKVTHAFQVRNKG